MWDEKSALSASIDRSIRFWDISSEEDCKALKGHGAAVSQMQRLNNSHNRLVSASLDGSIKIWEVYSGKCLTSYSEGHSGSGIQRMAMNQIYLASYSDENTSLVIRDFEKGTPLLQI